VQGGYLSIYTNAGVRIWIYGTDVATLIDATGRTNGIQIAENGKLLYRNSASDASTLAVDGATSHGIQMEDGTRLNLYNADGGNLVLSNNGGDGLHAEGAEIFSRGDEISCQDNSGDGAELIACRGSAAFDNDNNTGTSLKVYKGSNMLNRGFSATGNGVDPADVDGDSKWITAHKGGGIMAKDKVKVKGKDAKKDKSGRYVLKGNRHAVAFVRNGKPIDADDFDDADDTLAVVIGPRRGGDLHDMEAEARSIADDLATTYGVTVQIVG
jgi:hypothetical protein